MLALGFRGSFEKTTIVASLPPPLPVSVIVRVDRSCGFSTRFESEALLQVHDLATFWITRS